VKASIVANALSQKYIHAYVMIVKELNLISIWGLNLVLELRSNSVCLGMLKISSWFLEEIKRARERGQFLQERLTTRINGKEFEFHKDYGGIITFRDTICIPAKEDLRKLITEEAHKSSLSIHPGATKMYQDLKKMFWWYGIKKAMVVFVAHCLVCQKTKLEHRKPYEKLQFLDVPKWKWVDISIDFVTNLPINVSSHDAIWVSVDRLTKFC